MTSASLSEQNGWPLLAASLRCTSHDAAPVQQSHPSQWWCTRKHLEGLSELSAAFHRNLWFRRTGNVRFEWVLTWSWSEQCILRTSPKRYLAFIAVQWNLDQRSLIVKTNWGYLSLVISGTGCSGRVSLSHFVKIHNPILFYLQPRLIQRSMWASSSGLQVHIACSPGIATNMRLTSPLPVYRT